MPGPRGLARVSEGDLAPAAEQDERAGGEAGAGRGWGSWRERVQAPPGSPLRSVPQEPSSYYINAEAALSTNSGLGQSRLLAPLCSR